MNYPLGDSSETPFFKTKILSVLDTIPPNLSRLLLIRKMPFFCEHMPSGEPIFYDDQPPLEKALRSIEYDGCFSLNRPLIESPDFKDFCKAITLADILTKDYIELYDPNWLRLLFYVQKGSIPPSLLDQGLNQHSQGDYIFSTGTWPSKDKLRVVFGTRGISLLGQDNSIIKSCSYNGVKMPPASARELFFTLNLLDQPVNLPYDDSLPFKQLIQFGKDTT